MISFNDMFLVAKIALAVFAVQQFQIYQLSVKLKKLEKK